MAQFDLLIKGGTVVDGTGSPARVADIGVQGGQIVEAAPNITSPARRVVEADGHIVSPGWIDPHTHFDGQVAWDDKLDPSFQQGVTTVIMGNCGVGFAPVRPQGEKALIDIMEGVEDIPGTALTEAIPWGEWESYPEYLAYLRSRRYAMDFGSHMSHGALRAYVMGTDDVFRKVASGEQIAEIAKLVGEGVRAGAMGLSTNRAIGHRARSGEPVPGTYAAENELVALTRAMAEAGAGVLQMMPGGGMGAPRGIPDWIALDAEVAMMGRLSRDSGRPITYTMLQLVDDPEGWRRALEQTVAENARGAQIYPQIAPRQPGLLFSLSGYHPLMRRATYLKIRHLPLPERVREMRKPDIKAAILGDPDILENVAGSTENGLTQLLNHGSLGRLFPLGSPVCYEPELSQTVGGLAKSRGESEISVFYDLLLENEGQNVLVICHTNYVHGNFDAVFEMFMHDATVSGLSDAGAHVKFICDASIPTYTLSYFVRDRTRGPRIPLEHAVAKLTAKNADLYELHDRGRLLPGKRADLNVIDLAHLTLDQPRMHYDLPKGSGRFLQDVRGYRATLVNGVMTREHDADTGERPGRLISNSVWSGAQSA